MKKMTAEEKYRSLIRSIRKYEEEASRQARQEDTVEGFNDAYCSAFFRILGAVDFLEEN